MQPKSPNQDFDFILKDNKPAKRGFSMPNLPKPVLIGLAVLLSLILIIIFASVLSGRNKGNAQPFINVLGRGQETLRVTTLVQDKLSLQDPQTKALAATVGSVLSSDTHQLSSYLTKNHMKYSAAQLAAFTDKSSDATLETASQNNRLDAAYVDYLKTAISKYQTNLQNALDGAGSNGKKLINNSLESTRTLLNSSPLKT
ncbi:hypothetical protein KW794_01180 [Candidatus Saccharibacteria bacterium]|nr:hypothetical protein [Candidatus Saccharibacteria bacterium]